MQDQVYNPRQEEVIRSTINYRQFKFSKENRPISDDHMMKLYDAIEKKNLLKEFPILVDKDLTVIDGQHRLKVAESLGIPIYYILSERITVDDISETNDNTMRWRYSDYLARWCAAGKLDYLMLDRFCKKYTFLTLPSALSLCYFGDLVRKRQDFVGGNYKCNDSAYAERVATALLDLSKYTQLYKNRPFVHAYANLMANRIFEHKRMMVKMEYLSVRLVHCVTGKEYIKLIDDQIYNYKTTVDQIVTLRWLDPHDKDYRHDRKAKQPQLLAE